MKGKRVSTWSVKNRKKFFKSEHKEGEEVGKVERESWETHRKIE